MNKWNETENFPIDQPLLLFYKNYGQTIGGFSAKCWFAEKQRIMVGTVPDRWMSVPEDGSSKWKDISSAPKDCQILLFYPNRKLKKAIGQWNEEIQAFDLQWPNRYRSDHPSHWMDLPPDPKINMPT